MDVIAHTLWAGAIAKGLNLKLEKAQKKPLFAVPWTAFWGVFPDIFAFVPLFAWLIIGSLFRSLPFPTSALWDQGLAGPYYRVFQVTDQLYSFSHSLIVFAFIAVICWFFSRRMQWNLIGWLVHILLDIPSHSFEFYPTPFLWPLSDFKVDGISWSGPWFMIANYLVLVLVCLYLWRLRKKSQPRDFIVE